MQFSFLPMAKGSGIERGVGWISGRSNWKRGFGAHVGRSHTADRESARDFSSNGRGGFWCRHAGEDITETYIIRWYDIHYGVLT